MTASDDAREVLADHDDLRRRLVERVENAEHAKPTCCGDAHLWRYDEDRANAKAALARHDADRTARLARTLLALTGEQAVEAGTVVLREASGGWWDDGVAEDVVRAVLDAALAAAEEAR